ncbi:acyl carrier protein phosphodiesterase [Flavobacterium sp.]|uniref:acyl carrier protein phosphodiesterase n=1 Tax=Flavobacterium sp. TaxID=239 RepID=UPI0025B8B321|nr:acyl carrier protein phosphodiesterase [Flavobacterium sp.]
MLTNQCHSLSKPVDPNYQYFIFKLLNNLNFITKICTKDTTFKKFQRLDYVICFLTFPLEKAFINLSDDVVVNLITVALTRAKKKVIFYVPKYEDKYSRVLKLFNACPKPTVRINEHKGLNDFTYQNYLDMETCVTTLIKQSMIKYDWLKNYSEFWGIERALTGVAQRTAYKSNMEKAVNDLKEHYDFFDENFKLFFPQMIKECTNFLNGKDYTHNFIIVR